jgi:hypothetical protein
MAADLLLPGDMPGLLRRGSPVIWDGERVVSFEYGDGWITVASDDATLDVERADLRLDLTDPTGRVHAAWWAWRTWGVGRAESLILSAAAPHITEAEEYVLRAASLGRPMSDAEIATLRALCLRLAGREDV